jgi:outer membrane protein assembly factor BamB
MWLKAAPTISIKGIKFFMCQQFFNRQLKGKDRIPCLPFLFLLFLMPLFFFLFTTACSPTPDTSLAAPIEPLVADQENMDGDTVLRGRFSILNQEMKVYALAVSSSGHDILFSSDAGSVSMLDDRGRLRWEVFFEGLPVCACLPAAGNLAAVGTDQGEVFLMDHEGKILWQAQLEGAVTLLALAPGGKYLAVSLEKEGENFLYFYDCHGNPLWEETTGSLLDMTLFDSGLLYCLEAGKETNTLLAFNQEKEKLWELDLSQVSFSRCGHFAVSVSRGEICYYSLNQESKPTLIWSTAFGTEITWIGLTENGCNVIVYSTSLGSNNNLFAYNEKGLLLWEMKIPTGALLQASRFGHRIVASSWQEYSEDFSKVLVLDTGGCILQETEMASRIKKMALSSDGSILVLAGSDGNIFVLDISLAALSGEEKKPEKSRDHVFYNPVAMGCPPGEQYLTLFFYDEQARHLIPINRSVKVGTKNLQAAVDELVKGPRRLSGLSRTIPKDVAIKALLKDDIAFIDLPEELNRFSGVAQIAGIVDSLQLTISQFPFVEGICFLVGGEETNCLGSEALQIENPYPPRQQGQNNALFFSPHRAGERYYLLPRETVRLKDETGTADALVNKLLEEYRPFWPELPKLREIHVLHDEIILDWEPSLKKFFPPEPGPEQKEFALLFMDSLLLTLTSNLQPDRLVLFVEGQPWRLPEEYAALNLELKYPYYLNPE